MVPRETAADSGRELAQTARVERKLSFMKSVRELKPASPSCGRSLCSCRAYLLIGAMLLLAACSSTSTGVSSERLATANTRADAAEDRLADLRESLAEG